MGNNVAKKIEEKLTAALEPEHLEVIDDSHKHHGHVGARPEGETHFTIKVISAKFTGKSRVSCHRMINDILAEELQGPVHALAITTKAP